MNTSKLLALTLMTIPLSGCQPSDSSALNSLKESVTSTQNEVATLKTSIEELKQENLQLVIANQELAKSAITSKDIQGIYRRLMSLEQYDSATFDPTGQKSYQRINSNTGIFLVILDNVSPYLDGQKVTLSIGNPSSAKYTGFKLKLTWGMRFPEFDGKDAEEWNKQYRLAIESTKEKEISLPDTLQPGSWNKVSFNLAPAQSKEFGRLTIEMITDNVSLQTK